MPLPPDAIWQRREPAVARALRAMLYAHASGRPIEAMAAEDEMARTIGQTRWMAMMLGREWMWRAARRSGRVTSGSRMARRAAFNFVALVPSAPTFQEAVDSILRRTPAVAYSADEVSRIVAADGIAFARAANLTVARRVREMLANALQQGMARADAVQQIAQSTGWTRSYAATVYRTNAMTAYAIGTRDQARDTDGVEGLEFSCVGDADSRPNHIRANGFTARVADPIWQRMTPALGYNCRCSLLPVSSVEARRRFGRDGIPYSRQPPAGAGPDPGFRQ